MEETNSDPLPARDSFVDVPVTRGTSLGTPPEVPAGTWRWPTVSVNNATGGYVAKVVSDSHPDVLATLLVEYLTDTILRIDGEAKIDLRIVLKADLIVVMGEVECSHPAKGAIIHSDQFLMTLNSSMRDVLRSIKQTSGPSSPTASTNELDVLVAPNDLVIVDPTNAHIIITIEPSATIAGNTVVVAESSCEEQLFGTKIGRLIEEQIIKLSETSAIPIFGLVVEVSITKGLVSQAIDLSFTCAKMDQLVAEIARNKLVHVDPSITEKTIVTIRNVNRLKCTGESYEWAGKDWNHPKRFGHILAKLETKRITNICKSACFIKLLFQETRLVDVQLGTGSQKNDISVQDVRDRITSRHISELKTSIMGPDPHATFFSLKHGGSSCNPEFIEQKE